MEGSTCGRWRCKATSPSLAARLFPDGLDDAHLTLLRIDVTGGAFWERPGGVLQAMAAFTKSVVTGTPGKSGRAGTIDL